MNDLQRVGGISALINAAAYIIGFGMVFTLLAPIMNAPPDQYVAYLAENQTLMTVWYLMIYLVAGVFMVPLSLGLHDRLKDKAPALMQVATAFGLIWAGLVIASGMLYVNDIKLVTTLYAQDPSEAITLWRSVSAVERGLGGAIELPGGIWVLLVSLAALRTGGLPQWINMLGILIGIAGIVTVVPILYEAGSIFGLGCVVWFIFVGIVLARRR